MDTDKEVDRWKQELYDDSSVSNWRVTREDFVIINVLYIFQRSPYNSVTSYGLKV